VCPRVTDGGDGLQIWRVAENILNKQLQRAFEDRSFGLGIWQGLTTPNHKKSRHETLRNACIVLAFVNAVMNLRVS
jgi:hypothetical protein